MCRKSLAQKAANQQCVGRHPGVEYLVPEGLGVGQVSLAVNQ